MTRTPADGAATACAWHGVISPACMLHKAHDDIIPIRLLQGVDSANVFACATETSALPSAVLASLADLVAIQAHKESNMVRPITSIPPVIRFEHVASDRFLALIIFRPAHEGHTDLLPMLDHSNKLVLEASIPVPPRKALTRAPVGA